MNKVIIAVAGLLAGAAFAQPHGARPVGGPHGGGGYRGGGVRYAPGPRVVVRAPAPRVYVRPAYRSPVYVHPAPHYYARPAVRFYPALPVGVVTVNVGPRAYWYGGGAFYTSAPSGYQVIAPPIGAVVAQLPPGAAMQYINGYTYATAEGSWFFWDANQNAWVVVNAP